MSARGGTLLVERMERAEDSAWSVLLAMFDASGDADAPWIALSTRVVSSFTFADTSLTSSRIALTRAIAGATCRVSRSVISAITLLYAM